MPGNLALDYLLPGNFTLDYLQRPNVLRIVAPDALQLVVLETLQLVVLATLGNGRHRYSLPCSGGLHSLLG